MENWENEFKTKWITDGIDSDGINYAERFGKYLRDNWLSSSQIRNVFGEMKQLQAKLKANVNVNEIFTRYLLLYPKVAYASGRQHSKALQTFKDVFSVAYGQIKTKEQFQKNYNNLVDFVESTLAFHRAFGGK